jgi:hypothetical protein
MQPAESALFGMADLLRVARTQLVLPPPHEIQKRLFRETISRR